MSPYQSQEDSMITCAEFGLPFVENTTARIGAVGDWHATMALKAYRRRDYETYTRHIRIADSLRSA